MTAVPPLQGLPLLRRQSARGDIKDVEGYSISPTVATTTLFLAISYIAMVIAPSPYVFATTTNLCYLAAGFWREAVSASRKTLKHLVLDGAQLGEPHTRRNRHLPKVHIDWWECAVCACRNPHGGFSGRCSSCNAHEPARYVETELAKLRGLTVRGLKECIHLQRWQRCVQAIGRLCPHLETLVVRDCQHAPARELVQALILAASHGNGLQCLRHVDLEGCTSPSNAASMDAFMALRSLERLELAHAVFECSR